MINFWKLYKKAAPFFQISSEIRKGAAQSLTAYDWHSSKDASQHVCIYGTIKNRVHILPLIFKLISVYFSWICPKKRFRCNLFQVASKVLNKHVSVQHFRCRHWGPSIPANPQKSHNFRSQVSTFLFSFAYRILQSLQHIFLESKCNQVNQRHLLNSL